MGLTVGLLYNLGKDELPGDDEPPDIHAEFDREETIHAVADALRQAGHQVIHIEADELAWPLLRETRPDIVFNLAEGRHGPSREAQFPALLDLMGIPYTGSGVLTLALSLDKAMAKRLFQAEGVPTPAFEVVPPGAIPRVDHLSYPLFVKPAHEGSSMGIGPSSVVRDELALAPAIANIHRWYRQPALVEEFLEGREFTVGILGNRDPYFFPIIEVNFDPCPAEHGRVYSYHFKQHWDDWKYYRCPAPVTDAEAALLRATALRASRALGCLDVTRVDLRLDSEGTPNVLEVNPLPGMCPGFSDLPRMAEVAGMTYSELVIRILESARERYGLVQTQVERQTA
ncbi:MAG: D-alanine--D-alanine ligase [bacterium]|nr:D-alanine--D-alanine ligase [bacterium]